MLCKIPFFLSFFFFQLPRNEKTPFLPLFVSQTLCDVTEGSDGLLSHPLAAQHTFCSFSLSLVMTWKVRLFDLVLENQDVNVSTTLPLAKCLELKPYSRPAAAWPTGLGPSLSFAAVVVIDCTYDRRWLWHRSDLPHRRLLTLLSKRCVVKLKHLHTQSEDSGFFSLTFHELVSSGWEGCSADVSTLCNNAQLCIYCLLIVDLYMKEIIILYIYIYIRIYGSM